MNVSVGSDHRGVRQRQAVIEAITAAGCEAVDLGTHTEEACDYPDIAAVVGRNVSRGASDRGILICGTGIGRIRPVAAFRFNSGRTRAAVAHHAHSASGSRRALAG